MKQATNRFCGRRYRATTEPDALEPTIELSGYAVRKPYHIPTMISCKLVTSTAKL